MLNQFWFCTEPGLGYGVTAFTIDEAEQLLASYGYPRSNESVTNIIENVKFETLDQNHVVPNAGPLVVRGVWFPCHNV